jgi:recombination protein RecA
MARKKNEEKQEEEKKASPIELAKKALEKQFGQGIITQGAGRVMDVEFFSSQSIGIDKALGGGWPRGRMIEVYGPESSGKTTLCLHAIAQVQKEGGTAAFIDMEHALSPKYAASLGVDMEALMVSQPDNAQQALSIVETLVRTGAVELIVIDSVAALVPQQEIEGEMGDSNMGIHARLMSQAMRKLAGITYKTKTSIMWINQIRMKIGVMFGSPETVTGGNALKFYSSQRVDIRRIGAVKDGTEVVANKTRVKVTKNKVAPPFKEHEFDIVYGVGIDIYADLLDIAADMDVIQKSGSWYSYGEARLGQGRTQASGYLKEHPELCEEIREKIFS